MERLKFLFGFVILTLIPLQAHAFGHKKKRHRTVQQCVTVAPPPLPTQDVVASKIIFGAIDIQGEGCSAATTSAPDDSAVSVLFDQFSVTVRGSSRKSSDLKRCQITVPIQVPEGLSVSILTSDYRGFFNIPANSQVELRSSYSIQDALGVQNGSSLDKVVSGPFSDAYIFSIPEQPVPSRCGGNMTLRLDTSLSLQSRKDEAFASLDSIDAASHHDDPAQVFHLEIRPCDHASDPIPKVVCTTVRR